ncbi:MAG: hypothetical protein MRJ93_04740 [Nitrososphaeraceae archaeon]|nr:hypothetical protein [Nitrososphaeraceae archaeon]
MPFAKNTQRETSESSVLYLNELLDKTYAIPDKIKKLSTLITVPYTGHEFPILEEQVKEQLRTELVDDLFFIIDNLNRPQLLGNRMLKLASAVRYGWNGQGIPIQKH